MNGRYLVMGCWWGQVLRVERDSTLGASMEANRLRALGWTVTVLAELP